VRDSESLPDFNTAYLTVAWLEAGISPYRSQSSDSGRLATYASGIGAAAEDGDRRGVACGEEREAAISSS